MSFSFRSLSLMSCCITGTFLGYIAPVIMEAANGVAATTSGVDITKKFAKSGFNENAETWCMSDKQSTIGTCNSMELRGFRLEKINGIYTKDRSKLVQGRHIYINTNGLFFAYFCAALEEWRISVPEYVESVQSGHCRGWAAGIGLVFADSSVPNGITEWHQTSKGVWSKVPNAIASCQVNADPAADLKVAWENLALQ